LEQTNRSKPRTALLPGLMWFFVGLAMSSASLVANSDGPPMFVSLIPVAIGLAYLIYYFAEERKTLPSAAINSTP
jgi:lipopolysaccharide export LptBFGC system permease protein LptF